MIQGKEVPKLAHDKICDIIDQGIRACVPTDIQNKTCAVIIPDDNISP
jgi:hypothetical protein